LWAFAFFASSQFEDFFDTEATGGINFWIAIWIVRLIIAIDSRSNKNTLTTCHQTKKILIRLAIKPSSEWI
jgi:hypothetical protein